MAIQILVSSTIKTKQGFSLPATTLKGRFIALESSHTHTGQKHIFKEFSDFLVAQGMAVVLHFGQKRRYWIEF